MRLCRVQRGDAALGRSHKMAWILRYLGSAAVQAFFRRRLMRLRRTQYGDAALRRSHKMAPNCTTALV